MIKEEIVDHIHTMHLQNNTEKECVDRAFKFGIECAVDEMIEITRDVVIEELEDLMQSTTDGIYKTVVTSERLHKRIKELKEESYD